MTTEEVIELYEKYVIPNYRWLRRVIVRGEGSYIWDADGNRILDMFPGWAVSGLGHCHPHVVEAIRRQAGTLIHMDNTFYMEPQAKLAEHISTKGFGGKCFFCNSGAEAVEAAIKLARVHTPESRYRIITFDRSFHGRTFAAITATAQPAYHEGFGPLVPGFRYAKFNDIDSVRKLVDDETAAIMVEPIQGEGGVRIAEKQFLADLRQICDEHGMVLIFDEVQCGSGRTGKWFAYQHFGIEPDIMTLAKMLGSGVAIGAICAMPEVAESLRPGIHASTFGGNPLATAAAVATFEAIEKENLLENATRIGEYARQRLNQLKEQFDFIAEVRGLGTMIGIELTCNGNDIVTLCLEKGMRINCTHDNVLRMMPALNATTAQIDQAIDILAGAMAEYSATKAS